MPAQNHEVVRDGFSCIGEDFSVLLTRASRRFAIPRCEADVLRQQFLPKVTPEGQRRIANWARNTDIPDAFVRAQLKHYGVQYDESEISGDGADLLTKAVAAGKCDSVPQHISDLREQMYQEFIVKPSTRELGYHPEWIAPRYFLTSGQPDRSKTTTVVDIPCDRSDFQMKRVCEAAAKVEGLHFAKGSLDKNKHVFLGWDEAAVKKAAEDFVVEADAAAKAADEQKHQQRIKSQGKYLCTLDEPERVAQGFSPVGKYEIECEEITDQWPEDSKKMTMNIHPTNVQGLYKAQFDFGILVGVMIISRNVEDIKKYRRISDDEDESEDDEENEETNNAPTGSKRKAPPVTGPRKEAKVDDAEPSPFKYELRLRARETGEGDIFPDPCKGTIIFGDDKFTWFKGSATLPCVGDEPFRGYKVADKPVDKRWKWETFSW
ncbi:hypothetical protein PFICI_02773 [Pestalotiopsis fici W106-1]|uniref:Uncharacterized protein n=1 Tax=Pestalotiopsis fici (strain W106-1 / CGMCC3.15140) TaxID=1229662 RepID=W3XF96_PESFW|nr:uncharacterized protein PFICI_02773 [Pestalotiopsis fici W106-1]ETS84748.1 hypothetical protein PFICI_02773 [Pestalotiopsis fici W106-1]